MGTPIDLSQIPDDFDSLEVIDRGVAQPGQHSVHVSHRHLPLFPSFYLHVHCHLFPGDSVNGRLQVVFNEDGGAVYEASHRAFSNVADSPGSTESPTIAHVRDQGSLFLVPNASSFYLGAADVFDARLWVIQQNAPEKYRVLCQWTLGEAVSGGTNKHPRWGFMTGHFCGTVAGQAIRNVDVRLGAGGRMGSGSFVALHGTLSALFAKSAVYDDLETWSTSAVWRLLPADKAMFRRVQKLTNLPAPGASIKLYALADTNLAVRAARVQEAWVVKEADGIAEDPADNLRFTFTSTHLGVTAPTGAVDFSGYDYAYAVLHFPRP